MNGPKSQNCLLAVSDALIVCEGGRMS
jgi:hypothetical protein